MNKGKDVGKEDVASKGKGGGKGAPNGRNNKGKPERIEKELWIMLEQDERERYKQHLLRPADARRLARQRQKTQVVVTPPWQQNRSQASGESAAAGETAGEDSGSADAQMTKAEASMVPHKLTVDFGQFFNVQLPLADKEEKTVQDALCAMLSKTARASTAVKDKQVLIDKLKAELDVARQNGNTLLETVLTKELATEEAALNAMDTVKDEAAALLAEHKALGSARTTLDNDANARRLKDAQHDAKALKQAENFAAKIAEVRSQLTLLETQFQDLQAKAKAAWANKRELKDKKVAAMRALATERMNAAQAKLSPKHTTVMQLEAKSTVHEPAAAEGIPIPTLSKEQEDAEDLTGKKRQRAELEKLDVSHRQQQHYRRIEAEDLQDVTSIQPAPATMPGLVRLWETLQQVKMEAPGLLYTYEMFGLSHWDLEQLIGGKAVSKIFAGTQVKGTDVISNQIMELLRSQMTLLSDQIAKQRTDHEDQMKKAEEVMAEWLPKLRVLRETAVDRMCGACPY